MTFLTIYRLSLLLLTIPLGAVSDVRFNQSARAALLLQIPIFTYSAPVRSWNHLALASRPS